MTREERIAKMQSRQESSGNTSNFVRAYEIPKDVPIFKPKEGENRIDIIPYKISNPLNPAVTRDGFKIGDIDYYQHTHTHRRVGINNSEYLCANRMFGKPCAICNIQKDYWDAQDKENAKKLYPFERSIYNVIDLDEPEKGIQVWEVSYNWVEKELMNLAAMKSKRGKTIIYGDWEIGNTIVFYGVKEKFGGNEFIRPSNFSFEDREKQYDESICDKSYPLDQYYVMPDYNVVEADFLQTNDGSAGQESQPQQEQSKYEAPQYTEVLPEKVAGAKEPTFEEIAEADAKLLEGDEVIPPTVERGSRRRRERTEETTCPFNHVFGKDFDNHNDCTKCPDETYDKCGEKFDSLV